MFSLLDTGNLIEEIDESSIFSWTSILDFFRRIWDFIVGGFAGIIQYIKDAVMGVVHARRAIRDLIETVDYMIEHDSLLISNEIEFEGAASAVAINNFIGAIRWTVGDVIFYEMYIVLIILMALCFFNILSKALTFIQWIIGKIKFDAGFWNTIAGTKVGSWLINLFIR